MRGYPPLQIIIVILAFFLLAFPLWKLTRGNAVPMDSAASQEVASDQENVKEAVLSIRCAHAPIKLQVITAGGIAGDWENEGKWPQTLTIKIDQKKPVEIAIAAEWPKDVGTTAVTVDYSPEARETQSQTHWSIDSQIDDVFIFNPTAH